MSQPDPTPNNNPPIWPLVIDFVRGRFSRLTEDRMIADMTARDTLGRERYGTPLQARNGRDPLLDAYDEALDKAAYLRQYYEETGNGFRLFVDSVTQISDLLYEIQRRERCASQR